jgi:hypothetical protein
MNAEATAQQHAKRNPVWLILAVLLMFVCASCAGEWYFARRTAADLSPHPDLSKLAQRATVRSEQFGFAALTSFLLSVFLLGFTDPRSRNPGADPLQGYIRGLTLSVLGTLGFLILDGVVFFGLLVRNMHLQ